MTFEDMLLVAEKCFGELGTKTVLLWRQYNRDYFGGVLQPTGVLYVPTLPYGRCVGLTRSDHYIYLMKPGSSRSWGFMRGVLLHEMIHEHLFEAEKNPRHAGQPWCTEIMRLSQLLGKNIWAGRYGVSKVEGKSVRSNKARPAGSDAQILNQIQIAGWPHSLGIEPPDNLL